LITRTTLESGTIGLIHERPVKAIEMEGNW
jgi:hypothetical protein